MTTSSSTSTATTRRTRNDSPLADLLRRILAWMDGEHETVPMPMKKTIVPVPEVMPAMLEPSRLEPDDGLMKPADIVRAAGNLLWAYRSTLEISLDGSETDMEMHPEYQPQPTVRLPGGLIIRMPTNIRWGEIVASDGQKQVFYGKQVFNGGSVAIETPWRSIQIQAIIDTLGLENVVVREADDDGETPHDGHGQMLSMALGRFLEAKAPRISDRVHPHEDPQWMEIGEDVLMRLVRKIESRHVTGSSGRREPVDCSYVLVRHPVVGVVELPYKPVADALERRRLLSLTSALCIVHELPTYLPMPRGNAQLARVLRLCRDAVAAEPDLADAAGTPIRPLVDRDLPELMKRHAAAAAVAPVSELAVIDADLMKGIQRIKTAVEEALSCSAVARRQALKAQLRYLELRHPDAVPLLESIPDETTS